MRHELSGLSTQGLNGHRKGDKRTPFVGNDGNHKHRNCFTSDAADDVDAVTATAESSWWRWQWPEVR